MNICSDEYEVAHCQKLSAAVQVSRVGRCEGAPSHCVWCSMLQYVATRCRAGISQECMS